MHISCPSHPCHACYISNDHFSNLTQAVGLGKLIFQAGIWLDCTPVVQCSYHNEAIQQL